MAIPSEITALLERLNQELDQIEQEATEGLTLARTILDRFPDNFTVMQLFAFLNTALFFVERSRGLVRDRVEDISTGDVTADEEIQQAGEELAIELGRVLETKIRGSSVKTRLENLQ